MIENLYHKIFVQNIKTILKEIKSEINESKDYCLHITFKTSNIYLPKWLKEKYPKYITIVLQHCFHSLIISKNKFEVVLFFSGMPVKIEVPFNNIISISDIKLGFLSAYDSTEEASNKGTKVLNFEDLKSSSESK